MKTQKIKSITQVVDRKTNLIFYVCNEHKKRLFELIPTLEILETGESYCDVCNDKYNLKRYFN